MKMKVSVIALAAVMLVGCERPEIHSERRVLMRVDSVDIRSKSNSRVNLREVNSGMLRTDNRLSCNRHMAANIKIGSLWDVREITYVYPESKRYETRLVGTEAICKKSN